MVEEGRGGGDGGGVEVEEARAEDGAQDGVELLEELRLVVGVLLVRADCVGEVVS